MCNWMDKILIRENEQSTKSIDNIFSLDNLTVCTVYTVQWIFYGNDLYYVNDFVQADLYYDL